MSWGLADILHPQVLGMNARNLLYLRPYNSKRSVLLADDKLQTKRVLGDRGLPVPKLLGVIRSRAELEHMDWESLKQAFVLKPNRGFGGEGILVTRWLKAKGLTDLDGHPLDRAAFAAHVEGILEGHFSLANIPDICIIEQKIIPPPSFRALSPVGLPDVRVIVFNLIPVMAMLRLPTVESRGRANLHQGGVAIGLDLATGTGTYGIHHGERIDALPVSGVAIRDIVVPEWDRILLLAARAQKVSNVGYLAVDIALTRRGIPLVLEMNARGGLSIQLANRAPLRARLERVAGLKVLTSERGVRLSKELFGSQIEREVERLSGREILGRVEPVTLRVPGGTKRVVLAQVDPGKLRSVLDTSLATELGLVKATPGSPLPETTKLKYRLGAKDLTTSVRLRDLSAARHQFVVGTQDLVGFLIDPLRKATQVTLEGVASTPPAPTTPHVFVDPHETDLHLERLNRDLFILPALRPVNLAAERERFLADLAVNPQFVYRPTDVDLDACRRELTDLRCGSGPLGEIFALKRDELLARVDLLESVGSETFPDASNRLYDVGTPEEWAEARALPIVSPDQSDDDGPPLPIEEVVAEVQAFLLSAGIEREVRVAREQVAGFVVTRTGAISIRKNSLITRRRLRGALAHEVETHIYTAMNGAAQPYKIFSYGFGYFLATQEGLADLLKSRAIGGEDHQTRWSLVNYRAVLDAQQMSFSEVAARVRELGVPLAKSFGVALRSKRGMTDTRLAGACTKDAVYWVGRRQIMAWEVAGGSLRELFVGRISLDQLPLVRRITGLTPPRYLPEILR